MKTCRRAFGSISRFRWRCQRPLAEVLRAQRARALSSSRHKSSVNEAHALMAWRIAYEVGIVCGASHC